MRISGQPRAAHCLGCGTTFEKMHLKMIHVNTQRCGGRFLPLEERALYDKAKVWYEEMLRAERDNDEVNRRRYWRLRQECLSAAYQLRKLRRDYEQAA
jgi:NAD-dependent SIR2 family protein deacetylase